MIRLITPGVPACVSSGKLHLLSGSAVIIDLPPSDDPPGGSSPSALTLTDFVSSYVSAYPVVQRKAGTTVGDVPVLFSYAGAAPSAIQARVIAAVGGATVKDWTTLTAMTAAGGTGQGTLAGVPQGGWYLLQIRDSIITALQSNGAKRWGVGVVLLYQGQSNMVQTLSGVPYSSLVPGTSSDEYSYYNAGNVMGTVFDDAGWHVPSNGSRGPTGSSSGSSVNSALYFLRVIGKALKAKHGNDIPVAIIPWAFNATNIESFIGPAGDSYTKLFLASGVTARPYGFASPRNVYAGDFEGVLWHQGEANFSNASAVYKTKLAALYQSWLTYVAQFGRTAAHLWFGVAVLGNYTAGSTVENIRRAELEFATEQNGGAWPRVQIGWSTVDLWRGTGTVGTNPPSDSLHFSGQPRARRSMLRTVQSVLHWLGASGNGPSGQPYSGRGPTLGSHSRSGMVVTFTVQHEGGNALVVGDATTNAPATGGAAPTGFYANTAADFTGTYITPTAALVNGNTQIALTFPDGTSFPVYVKYQGGRVGETIVDANGFTPSGYPDIRRPIYDNTVYPLAAPGVFVAAEQETLGLPLLPTAGAITVA